jgi:hypothetical protein
LIRNLRIGIKDGLYAMRVQAQMTGLLRQ